MLPQLEIRKSERFKSNGAIQISLQNIFLNFKPLWMRYTLCGEQNYDPAVQTHVEGILCHSPKDQSKRSYSLSIVLQSRPPLMNGEIIKSCNPQSFYNTLFILRNLS